MMRVYVLRLCVDYTLLLFLSFICVTIIISVIVTQTIQELKQENKRLKEDLNDGLGLQGTPNLIVEQRSPSG